VSNTTYLRCRRWETTSKQKQAARKARRFLKGKPQIGEAQEYNAWKAARLFR